MRQRVIATDRVRYVGQPVALVVAQNRYLAEDAAALVEIDYETLPPVTDHLPRWSPARRCSIRNTARISSTKRDSATGIPNFVAREGDLVIRKRFEFHRQTAVPMENRGVIAKLIDDGERLHVESTTQIPQTLHSALATRVWHGCSADPRHGAAPWRRFRMQRDGVPGGDYRSRGGAQTEAARPME